MSIVGQFWLPCDGFGSRTPFLDSVQCQASFHDAVYVRGHRPMLFDDTFHEPVPHSLAFDEVVVERPDPVAVVAQLE